jgi:hypothetical protein
LQIDNRLVVDFLIGVPGLLPGLFTFVPRSTTQAHAPKPLRAVIISNRNFFRSAGGACGLAISAALLQAVLRTHLPDDYRYLASQTYTLPSNLLPADSGVFLDAYMTGSRAVFILQIPQIGLCLLGTFFIKDRALWPPEERVPAEDNVGALEVVVIVEREEAVEVRKSTMEKETAVDIDKEASSSEDVLTILQT